MAFKLEFEQGVARLIAEGAVTYDDVVAMAAEVYRDPRFVPPTRLLWDVRAGQEAFDSHEIGRLVEFFRSHRPDGPGRSAIVVNDELTFGLSRMFALLAEQVLTVDMRVFRDVDVAIAWLREDTSQWSV